MSEESKIREMFQNFGMVAYYSKTFTDLFATAILRKAKKTYTVVDVGFNTGQFSRLALTCFDQLKMSGKIPEDSRLRIVGFEPNSFLADAAPHFQGLELHKLALSNETCTQSLHVPIFEHEPDDLESGAKFHRNEYGGVYGTSTLGDDRQQQLKSEMPNLRWKDLEVQTTTLDEFCKHNDIDEIDWLKIDVEFFERKVLDGAKNLLSNAAIRCGQFEGDTRLNAETLDDALGNNEKTQQFLERNGLQIVDTNYNIVNLPTLNNLIDGEFFFVGDKF